MESQALTIWQAKEKLDNGCAVRHTLFSPDEFIVRRDNGQLCDEQGIDLIENLFWEDRKDIFWQVGWSIVQSFSEIDRLNDYLITNFRTVPFEKDW
jgi:hypothetical protein